MAVFDHNVETLGSKIDSTHSELDRKITETERSLRGEIGSSRNALDQKITEAERSLRGEIKTAETNLGQEISAVRTKVEDAEIRLTERISRVEGALAGAGVRFPTPSGEPNRAPLEQPGKQGALQQQVVPERRPAGGELHQLSGVIEVYSGK